VLDEKILLRRSSRQIEWFGRTGSGREDHRASIFRGSQLRPGRSEVANQKIDDGQYHEQATVQVTSYLSICNRSMRFVPASRVSVEDPKSRQQQVSYKNTGSTSQVRNAREGNFS